MNEVVECGICCGSGNNITADVLEEMDSMISNLGQDNNTHVVFLRSTVKGVFSRGLDISAVKSMDEQQLSDLIAKSRDVLDKIVNCSIPFICGVDGDCFGAGLELVMSCDIKIATSSSVFGAPEVIFGLVPTEDCIRRLFATVGLGQTSRLLLSGMKIGAPEALKIGLIEEVVSEENLQARCTELAKRLGRISRNGITAVKAAIRKTERAIGEPLLANQERPAINDTRM